MPYISFDDKDPVWMNETIKLKRKGKNNMYNKHIQNWRFESDSFLLEMLITELNELINTTKALYYQNLSKKLDNPLSQVKPYRSNLKTFYNEKKIPLIPSLLVNDKFVTDIKTKVCIFNKFFAEQYTPLKNESIVPVNKIFLTQARLSSLDLNEDEIRKIIWALNIYKAQAFDDIPIRMIKTCGKSLTKPLIILFKNSTKSFYHQNIWNRPKIIPLNKKKW